MSSVLNCKINVQKIDKEKHLFVGEKGIYLDFTVAERKEPGKHGETHSIYIKKQGEDKIYIGDGTLKVFDDSSSGATSNAGGSTEDLPF